MQENPLETEADARIFIQSLVKDERVQSMAYAAFRGDLEAVRAGIRSGVPLEEPGFIFDSIQNFSYVGFATPLMAAVARPRANCKVIDLLLSAGAQIDGVSTHSPLRMAVVMKATRHALYLLDRGANPWLPGLGLLRAAQSPRLVRRLLASNPPYEELIDGMFSTYPRCGWKIRKFVRAGADPNHRFDDGATLLHRARDEDTVRALVRAGAEIDAIHEDRGVRDDESFPGWTPVGTKVQCPGNAPIFAAIELIRLGADVHFVHASGKPIFLAAIDCYEPDDRAIKAFLEAGADPTITWRGENALHFLARQRYQEEELFDRVLPFLIEADVPIDARNGHGSTPLFEAVSSRNAKIIPLLLEAGADPDLALTVDAGELLRVGMTPLMGAVLSPDIVRLLLAAGADPFAIDAAGQTALDYARADLSEQTEPDATTRAFALKADEEHEVDWENPEPDYHHEWFDARDEVEEYDAITRSIALLEEAMGRPR